MSVFIIYGITYGFSAAVMPGPLSTYLVSQTLKNGWRNTLPAAFSPLITDGPIALLVLLVLSQFPVWLEQVLRFSGGFFLLYLAVGAIQSWRNYYTRGANPVRSNRQSVLNAAIVNWLNPNPYLGWSLVLGPLLLKGWRETPVNGIALLIGFYVAMIASMMGIIMAFGAAGSIGSKVNRTLIALSAIALACFGFYQLWVGATAYMSG
jgi:threonine/homoserine/homoserine lactone efflux protein